MSSTGYEAAARMARLRETRRGRIYGYDFRERGCVLCGAPMRWRNANALYCSDLCRQRAHRAGRTTTVTGTGNNQCDSALSAERSEQ